MRSLLFSFTVLFGLAGVTRAALLLDQNFDDTGVFVNGNTLTATGIGNSATTVGEWTTVDSVLPGSAITDAESFSSTQSLAVNRDGSNTAGTGQFLGVFDSAVATGIVDVSFRAKRNRAGFDSSDPADGVGDEFTGSGSIFQVGEASDLNATFPATTDIGFRLGTDNNLYVFHAATETLVANNIDPLGFGNSGTWHGFKLVIDLDAATYDAYYSADGTNAGFVQVFDDAAFSSANVGSVDAVTGRSLFYTIDRGPVWYDDVRVESVAVPEPSSMTLLGIAGLGLVVHSRRKQRQP